MVNMKFLYQCIIIFFIVQGCSSNMNQEDFIGIWKSTDGASIELKKDGTYLAKKVNYYNFYLDSGFLNKRIDFTGTWKLINKQKGNSTLQLNSNSTYIDYGINKSYTMDGKSYSHKIAVSFEITGQGMFENKLPWILYTWIGDPDNVKKYIFLKQ